LGLSANRARRLWDINNKFACPIVRESAQVYTGSVIPQDIAQFRPITTQFGWRLTSYLSPASFHYCKQGAPGVSTYLPPAATGNPVTLKYLHPNPATLPANYTPRLDKVGIQLSSKVIVADGTRYYDASGVPRFDFDPFPAPSIFGNFLSTGPIFNASTEYGRDFVPGNDTNIKASFRHSGRSINAGFFDGHVSQLKSKEVWENAEAWFPSNSQWTGASSTPEAVAKYQYLMSRPVGSRGLP